MKKILILFVIACVSFLLLIGALLQQIQSSVAAMFSISQNDNDEDSEERNTCTYEPNIDKFFDDETEKVREEFEKKIDGYFLPVALAMYQTDKISTVDMIVENIKSWDTSKGVDQNLQVHKYGEDYSTYLSSINEKHSLGNSKKYFKEKFEDKNDTRAYAYYLDVLSLLNDDCKAHVSMNDWDVPMTKPLLITQQFGIISVTGSIHLGIDLSEKYGASVYSVTTAVVDEINTSCDPDGGYLGNFCAQGQGNFVRLKVTEGEQDIYIVYMHLSTVNVIVGEMVTVGQKVGEQGHSGNSTGSHLHLEFRRVPNVVSKYEDVYDPHEFIDFY